jgi:hypothetical protein
VVRTRILVAVGAWLLGVVTATGLSLLAVAQLGQGLVDKTSQQQLTVGAVNTALAHEKTEASATPSARPARTADPAAATRVAHAVHPRAARPPAQQASPPPPSPPPGTLLTSGGGTVLATCEAAGAYLLTWSPQQGYEAQNVVRGPATVVSVRFAGPSRALTMRVGCNGNTPTVLSSGWSGGEGGDD